MKIYDIINKKKRGYELSEQEIRFFVKEYTADNLPDYQISALLMAICIKGMSDKETAVLTDAIAKSGDVIDLAEFGSLSADKHSTGGVGDKTTLITAPLAAALGCKVAKMSGRGLGHTGGTIDKLESIPGYKTALSPDEFFEQVRKVGISVIGQSGNLAPADKKLYALRDVTATVDSIPLITSSIMGKKLASGAKSIVLDVKYGSGAFLKTPKEAEILADKMVTIGNLSGRQVGALITNMDLPLGYAIGNALEVKEAVSVLRGSGPSDLTAICIELSAAMAHLSLNIPINDARSKAKSALSSGLAFEKFKDWISAQGADEIYAENTDLLPSAEESRKIIAEDDGYIAYMDAEAIGLACVSLGAGRRKKNDSIDFGAGIILEKKTGDCVKKGDTLATLYAKTQKLLDEGEAIFKEAVTVSESSPKLHPLIYKTILR